MSTTGRLRRWLQGTAGAAFVTVGLLGLTGLWQGAASAQAGDRTGSHEAMHEMMDAMHGEGTTARMHEVKGAEEMMDQCTSMMAMMGDMDMAGMGGMMRDGGMMDGMMDGRGMSDMGGMTDGMMGSR